MRVLAYLHSYPPQRWLGGELMTSSLLSALAAAGHDVRLLCRTATEEYERGGVRVLPRKKQSTPAEVGECDVFITHPEIASFYYPRISASAVPYIGIVHNLSDFTIDGLRRYVPTVTVANAKATANAVLRRTSRQCEVIHPPTSVNLVPGMTRRYVTLVNLSREKGGDLFYRLARARPDLDFLGVVGGYGEQIVPADLPPNVHLLGQSPSMGLIYSLTRVLLFPSLSETYGMVAAEASVAGAPVLAHRLLGIEEALGDSATWLDRDDDEAWLDALDSLRDEKAWQAAADRSAARGAFLTERTGTDLARWIDLVESVGVSH